jgi:hypothetical protein
VRNDGAKDGPSTREEPEMTTIDVRKGDVLEVQVLISEDWRFYKRLNQSADVREAKGLLADPRALCGWRLVRDGVEVG